MNEEELTLLAINAPYNLVFENVNTFHIRRLSIDQLNLSQTKDNNLQWWILKKADLPPFLISMKLIVFIQF